MKLKLLSALGVALGVSGSASGDASVAGTAHPLANRIALEQAAALARGDGR